MQPDPTQIDTQFLDTLETKLGQLAAQWRGTTEPIQQAIIVYQYQLMLRNMVELGFRSSLDADAALPDEYMPSEYLNLFR